MTARQHIIQMFAFALAYLVTRTCCVLSGVTTGNTELDMTCTFLLLYLVKSVLTPLPSEETDEVSL